MKENVLINVISSRQLYQEILLETDFFFWFNYKINQNQIFLLTVTPHCQGKRTREEIKLSTGNDVIT